MDGMQRDSVTKARMEFCLQATSEDMLPEQLKAVQSELAAKERDIKKLTSLAEHAMEAVLLERARADCAQDQCSHMAQEASSLPSSNEGGESLSMYPPSAT